MLRNISGLFSVAFIGAGIAGFVPGITVNGELLGIFDVGLVHNLVHVVSGLLALAATTAGGKYPRLFFQCFGVGYGLFTIAGFLEENSVLGLFGVNMPDNLLHLSVSFASLALGFLTKPISAETSAFATVEIAA